MAAPNRIALLLYLSFLFPSAFGAEVICRELGAEACAFAVSSLGKRCVLERFWREKGEEYYECRESEVAVESSLLANSVETNSCVASCGADRRTVGISSDALLDRRFTAALCSSDCYANCPNIVDLFVNLAAAEGVVLPDLCEIRRALHELSSSAAPAAAPDAILSSELDRLYGALPELQSSAAPAAAPAAILSGESDGLYGDINESDGAPSDVSEYTIDAASDEMDADPIPVPALSPSALLDVDQEVDDADFT